MNGRCCEEWLDAELLDAELNEGFTSALESAAALCKECQPRGHFPVIGQKKLEGKESEEGGKNHWEVGDLHVAKFPFAHEAKIRKRALARKTGPKRLNLLSRFFPGFCDRAG